MNSILLYIFTVKTFSENNLVVEHYSLHIRVKASLVFNGFLFKKNIYFFNSGGVGNWVHNSTFFQLKDKIFVTQNEG